MYKLLTFVLGLKNILSASHPIKKTSIFKTLSNTAHLSSFYRSAPRKIRVVFIHTGCLQLSNTSYHTINLMCKQTSSAKWSMKGPVPSDLVFSPLNPKKTIFSLCYDLLILLEALYYNRGRSLALMLNLGLAQ